MSQDNNKYWETVAQGRADAAKGLTPNNNVPPQSRQAYSDGYNGKK